MTTHPSSEQLLALHERDCTPQVAASLTAHLEQCPTCHTTYASLASLESALTAPRAVEVPAQFANRVMLRVELEPTPVRSWLLPNECIAPLVLGVVGISLLAMQTQGATFSIEGISGAQIYAIATAALLGLAPLLTGLRAIARG